MLRTGLRINSDACDSPCWPARGSNQTCFSMHGFFGPARAHREPGMTMNVPPPSLRNRRFSDALVCGEFMGPYVDSIVADEQMPAATAVAVIGGGIIGTSAALTLAARGIPVVLCEKGYIACEQSSRNWGWCRQAGRDEREMPLIVESLRLWREMDRTTGAGTGFRECGVMYVAESEDDERHFQEWLRMAKPYGVDARLVRGARLEAL